MHINVAKPFPHKPIILYELHNIFVFCLCRHRECSEEGKDFGSVFQIPASKLTDNKLVTDNVTVIQ